MTKKELIEKIAEKSDDDAIDEFLTVVSPEKPVDDKSKDDKPKDDKSKDEKFVTVAASELYALFTALQKNENIKKEKEKENVFNF